MPSLLFFVTYQADTKEYDVQRMGYSIGGYNFHVRAYQNNYCTEVAANDAEEALRIGMEKIQLYLPDTPTEPPTPAPKPKITKPKKTHTATRQLIIHKQERI